MLVDCDKLFANCMACLKVNQEKISKSSFYVDLETKEKKHILLSPLLRFLAGSYSQNGLGSQQVSIVLKSNYRKSQTCIFA